LTQLQNPFVEFAQRFGPAAGEMGPGLFVREVLGVEPDEWQEAALRAFGRSERHISIRSCHGVGKTALLSWLVIYMLLFRYPQKTVATAPSKAQLEDALVAEVMHWFNKLPGPLKELFEAKKNRLELRRAPESSFFSAKTAREENPEALQGVHSDHVLLIADEASGVSEKIFEAAVGSMSGENATTVLAGNPVRTSGLFFDTHNRLRAGWFTLHVTGAKRPDHNTKEHGYYSPRVGEKFIQEVVEQYGENSNAHRIRALGEFPLADQDTVIPYDLIASAQTRDIVLPKGATEIWGLDVARFGDDSNVLIRRNKRQILPLIEEWQGRDLMQTAGKVKALWDALPAHERPEEILIDSIGLGAGVEDRLAELGLPVRGINVSESASNKDLYRNLRTELWYEMRAWLAARNVTLPAKCECERCSRVSISKNHATMLAVELSAQRSKYTSMGRLICYPKDDMKKLLKGRSPNLADAMALTFASEPATLLHGSSNSAWSSNWNEPIRLRRAVV
jgi:phage terminase large subunit